MNKKSIWEWGFNLYFKGANKKYAKMNNKKLIKLFSS